MREHIVREAASYDLGAAWFIIPMSVAAAVLIAVGSMPGEAEADTPAPVVTLPAAVPTEAPKPTPVAEPLPVTEHIQAF
jgi:hypothetical protein